MILSHEKIERNKELLERPLPLKRFGLIPKLLISDNGKGQFALYGLFDDYMKCDSRFFER